MILGCAPLNGLADLNFENLFSVKSDAATILAATGQCGNDVYWTFDEITGELVISRTGKMKDYSSYVSPFYDKDSIKSVTCTVTDEYGNSVSDTANVTVGFVWWQWIIGTILFGFIWY